MADKDEKRGYEGPVNREAPTVPPDAAKQTPEQYVASRMGAVPQAARFAMGFPANPEMYMYMELMFRSCYWRERHDMLERNAQALIRQLLASRATVYAMCREKYPDAKDDEIKEKADALIGEQLKGVAPEFKEMPKI
jgi:hypothetical protein